MARWFWRTAIAAVISFGAGSAFAQPFPAKPVHILVPYPPGGGVDVLSHGHAGNGTSTHLAGELLKNLAEIDFNAIPCKIGIPAINDLLGGQIPMSFNNGPESVGQLQAGTVRALAVTTAARALILPDVPSLSEA